VDTRDERTILAFKLQPKANPDKGEIRPVAEIIDGKLYELNQGNFCHTNKVFVTTSYQIIDDKFKNGQMFRITVNLSEQMSTIVDPYQASKYVTTGVKAERLKPNELIEIIEGELPDRNKRYFENGSYPSTDYIFVRAANGDCFGPFSWECKDDDDAGFYLGLLNDKPLLKSYQLSIGQAFKITSENFDKYAFTFWVEDRNYHFALSIHDFIGEYGYYDYASDEEIVKHCSKLAADIGSQLFNKKSWDGFKQLASNNVKFSQGLNKTRLAQLSTLANDLAITQEEICDNIETFLRSNNGDQLVQDFVERKRPQLIDGLRKSVLKEKSKEIDEKEEKLKQIELRAKEKDKELKELSAEVERKRKEANQEVILEQAVAERNEKLRHLDQAIIEKEKQVSDIAERFNLSADLSEIIQQIEEKKVIHKHYENENALIEATTKRLKIERDKTEDELRTKLIELKPFVEHINGSFFVHKTEKDRAVFVETNALMQSDILESQRLVVETVKHNLRLKGRDFEAWQVANLLISTQQSFITFLAGLPGVGKTSLARLIAESQQLESRLQEVSVARGWTSQKDLIGFYNPLSNRFQSSNTGLYTFIEALSVETKKDEQAMAYVLLDEANLSPIEHYWSTFMAMADGEGERVLRLGQELLSVPTALRFLATINYDGTTEPLSPRVVDRAPVLVMESSNTTFEEMDSTDEKMITLPLSAVEMNKLFGLVKNTPAFQDDEKEIFNKVRDILSHPNLDEGRPLSVSLRKEIVIRQYCAQAGALMRSFGCDDFKALDLAILQHVLPQVRGSGQKFAKRLTKLKQTCDDSGLKGSANYLERMLAYGETELHSYDFFCW
jgi:hypothetical protein